MSPLRVAIDAFNLSLPSGTGIATYTRTLESALFGLTAEIHAVFGMRMPLRTTCPLEVAFFDAFRLPPPRGAMGRARRLAQAVLRAGRPMLATRIPLTGIVDHRQFAHRLPRHAALHNVPQLFNISRLAFRVTGKLQPIQLDAPVDVFHLTCPLPITMHGVVKVCTVHDLIPLQLPFTTLESKPRFWRLIRRLGLEFDMLFTVSQATKLDLVRLFEIPEERIFVTYQGTDIDAEAERESADDLAAQLEAAFGLAKDGYLLFVGAIEPKKNLPRLFAAYLASGLTLPLVIAGPDGWQVEEEMRLLTSGACRGRSIIRIPYVPRAALLRLYRGARALVFPSLSEGFGLPALEAMMLGCPVVAADSGALPETCADAVLYVDPYDSAAIAAALRAVAGDAALCARLSAAGRRQASRFSMSE